MRKSKATWCQNNKDYYRRGGHGYEYMAQKITCGCGHTTTYNRCREHLKSKITKSLTLFKEASLNDLH